MNSDKKSKNNSKEVELKIDHSKPSEKPTEKLNKEPVVTESGIKDGGLKPFNEDLVKDVDEANRVEGVEPEIVKKSPPKPTVTDYTDSSARQQSSEDTAYEEELLRSKQTSKFHPKKSVIGTSDNVVGIKETPTIYADKKIDKKIKKSKEEPKTISSNLVLAIPIILIIILFVYIYFAHPDVIDSLIDNIKTMLQ